MSVNLEAVTHVKVVVTGEDELLFLRNLLQNPTHDRETEAERIVRGQLFDACDRGLYALEASTRILDDSMAPPATPDINDDGALMTGEGYLEEDGGPE